MYLPNYSPTHLLTYLLTYLLTHSLTHSMKQSPSWEANQISVSQEIPCILWNLKVYYHVYRRLPPDPILSQIKPVHPPCPTGWRSILMLSSHPCLGLPNGLLCQVSTPKPYMHLTSSPKHATCPAHLILLNFITWIIFYTNTTLLENTDPLIFTTNLPLFSSQVTKCMLNVYYQFATFCYIPLRK